MKGDYRFKHLTGIFKVLFVLKKNINKNKNNKL